MGRISRDRRDIYYRRAKEEGFRARSAYKLLQLDDELHFLSPPQCKKTSDNNNSYLFSHSDTNALEAAPCDPWADCCYYEEEIQNEVNKEKINEEKEKELDFNHKTSVWDYPHRAVDLCAAPGSWTQVLRRRLWQNYELKMQEYNSSNSNSNSSGLPDPPMIVAVDLQELAPIPGVFMLKGDITHASTCASILSFFKQKPADLVVCDGAPDVTGMRDLDEFIQMQLLLSALGTASQVLRSGGTFVCKVFRGEQAPLVYMQLLAFFADVRCCKPAASRSSSVEAFVVCRGFTPALRLSKGVLRQEEEMVAAAVAAAAAAEGQKGGEMQIVSEKAAGNDEEMMNVLWQKEVVGELVPFVSCGDIQKMDADRNYRLAKSTYTSTPPTQPPTHPAYELAVLRKRGLL